MYNEQNTEVLHRLTYGEITVATGGWDFWRFWETQTVVPRKRELSLEIMHRSRIYKFRLELHGDLKSALVEVGSDQAHSIILSEVINPTIGDFLQLNTLRKFRLLDAAHRFATVVRKSALIFFAIVLATDPFGWIDKSTENNALLRASAQILIPIFSIAEVFYESYSTGRYWILNRIGPYIPLPIYGFYLYVLVLAAQANTVMIIIVVSVEWFFYMMQLLMGASVAFLLHCELAENNHNGNLSPLGCIDFGKVPLPPHMNNHPHITYIGSVSAWTPWPTEELNFRWDPNSRITQWARQGSLCLLFSYFALGFIGFVWIFLFVEIFLLFFRCFLWVCCEKVCCCSPFKTQEELPSGLPSYRPRCCFIYRLISNV